VSFGALARMDAQEVMMVPDAELGPSARDHLSTPRRQRLGSNCGLGPFSVTRDRLGPPYPARTDGLQQAGSVVHRSSDVPVFSEVLGDRSSDRLDVPAFCGTADQSAGSIL
jgi:hypothetical protein